MCKDFPVVLINSSGKVNLAKHNVVSTINVKTAQGTINDGEFLSKCFEKLGSCEVYPKTLRNSPNGHFVPVCGDGEFKVYTPLSLRNNSFGSADEVVWNYCAREYATRVGSSDIRVFNEMFKERK